MADSLALAALADAKRLGVPLKILTSDNPAMPVLDPHTLTLIRPDQHVCARWRAPTEAAVRAALATATTATATA